jgi:hypothetical protein
MAEIPQVLSARDLDPARVIRSGGIDPVCEILKARCLFLRKTGLIRPVAATECQHFGLLVERRSAMLPAWSAD